MFSFHALSLPVLIGLFLAAAAAVWVAGIWLSNTTDTLSRRFHLGEALGGIIILAITTNLPEIAISVSAAVHHNLGIAIGNVLGGIAIQTVVLVILDIFGLRAKAALTYQAASLSLVLEGILVVAVLVVSIMGTQMPDSLIWARITPGGILILVFWIAGIALIGKARQDLPWQEKGNPPGVKQPDPEQTQKETHNSMPRTTALFLAGSLVTLVAGVVLEGTGEAIASHIHLSGVLFGATVLAAATALPEVSTGLASIKLGAYQLAISDIFGGNAFLPVLFLVATLISGQSVLPQAQKTDIYLAALGILLTSVYLYGLIFRPQRQIFRMGIDSLIVLLLYAAGMVGLFVIAH